MNNPLYAKQWHPLSIAPMVGYTNRHGRYMLRLLAPKAQLFTEMLIDRAVLQGSTTKLLSFDCIEHPVLAQLAGANVNTLARAAEYVESFGYDGLNLNIGCPSPRVQKGGFGACLFESPELVAAAVKSLKGTVNLPISVKCRLGTENTNGYLDFVRFIDAIVQAGVDSVIVHARIAVLSGLNTSQNLNVPPLQYDQVEQMKQEFPHLHVVINGGIRSAMQVDSLLQWADGVMLGRLALHEPRTLFEISNRLDGVQTAYDPVRIARSYARYARAQFEEGTPLSVLIQPLLHLFAGFPGARRYRQLLSQHHTCKDSFSSFFEHAISVFNSVETVNA